MTLLLPPPTGAVHQAAMLENVSAEQFRARTASRGTSPAADLQSVCTCALV